MDLLSFRPVDAFHASIRLAIVDAGYDEVQHLGCASGRAFAVVATPNPLTWLSPRLAPEEQILALVHQLGIASHLTVAPLSELDRWLNDAPGVLVGPLTQRLLVPHAEHAYFYGQSLWAYVRRRGTEVIATDTLGFPEIQTTSDEIRSIADPALGRLYIVHPGGTQRAISWSAVLAEGLAAEGMVAHSLTSASTTIGSLSVRLGIRWYMAEIVRIVNLLLDVGDLSTPKLDCIERHFSAMSRMRSSQDIQQFLGLRRRLWRQLGSMLSGEDLR